MRAADILGWLLAAASIALGVIVFWLGDRPITWMHFVAAGLYALAALFFILWRGNVDTRARRIRLAVASVCLLVASLVPVFTVSITVNLPA
jgi:hypothetical protein